MHVHHVRWSQAGQWDSGCVCVRVRAARFSKPLLLLLFYHGLGRRADAAHGRLTVCPSSSLWATVSRIPSVRARHAHELLDALQ